MLHNKTLIKFITKKTSKKIFSIKIQMNTKITLLLLTLFTTLNLIAQKDTIYYNTAWQKAQKKDANYYRPLPLKKVGDLYEVKDYYINGNLQMEGYYTNTKDEKLEGTIKWYYKNGTLSQEQTYSNGALNGEATNYSEKGFLRAKGIFKNGEYWSGTFLNNCCKNSYIAKYTAYKKGKETGHFSYYANSNQIALNSVIKNDSTKTTTFFNSRDVINTITYFNRKGENIGKLTTINNSPEEGKEIIFYVNDEKDVVSIQDYYHYKEGKQHGEEATFTKEGKQFSKGNYKNEKPYSGTIYRFNSLKTYEAGKLEGPEIGYSSEMKPISKGINKDNKPWSGEFINNYRDRINNYKNGKLEGKQLSYFGNDLKQIQSYYTLLNDEFEGESATYNKEGKELVKGIYKNGKAYDGTFFIDGFPIIASYKKGLKHGISTTYDSSGNIIKEQEYKDGKLTGNITSKDYNDTICNCIYQKGNPYSGKVCEEYLNTYYENGIIMKDERYSIDYKTREVSSKTTNIYDKKGAIKTKTEVVGDKSHTLTFKNDEPYNGVNYNKYTKELITYKKGKKDGVFSNLQNNNNNLIINGKYKNNLWHGKVFFYEKKIDKRTNCIYKKGKPQNGTVVEGRVLTPYKNGLKHGTETLFASNRGKIEPERITEYHKGNILNTIWPNRKNEKGEIIKGTFKNNKPYNGDFFEFKAAIGTFSHYKNGLIIGAQYQGYYDNKAYKEQLIPTDTLVYKNGKPYSGTLLEYPERGRFHIHKYDEGKIIKTSITRDNLKRSIRNTVTYTDDGFNVYENTDFLGSEAKYLNKEKTKVKIVYTHNTFFGFVEYYNNNITGIDITYNRDSNKIKYELVNNQLLVTSKDGDDFLIKSYPKVTEISYKNFLDLENLFIDEEVFMETYINNKKVAEGIRKNKDMYDGIHIMFDSSENTYLYFKLTVGGKTISKRYLTKEKLLKLLDVK